jgi:hypothetical protein
VYLNLRNPYKAALSATVQHLTGLLPTHIAYSAAHGRVSQQWLWSTGDNPNSLTSSHASFNQMQVDVAQRHMIIGVLQHSLDLVNHAVEHLGNVTTTRGLFK